MAFKKKTFRKKRKVFRRKAVIRRMPRPEVKYHQEKLNTQTIDSTGFVVDTLSTLVVGAQDNQRIGKKIFARWLMINADLLAGDTVNRVRICVCRIKGAYCLTYADTNLYNAGVGAQAWVDFYDMDKTKMIRNKIITLAAAPENSQVIKRIQWKIPIFKTITFDLTTGQSTIDPIYIACISDSTITTHPTMNICWRVTFTDN